VVQEEVRNLSDQFEITVVADSIEWNSDIAARLEDLSTSTGLVRSIRRLRELIEDSDVVHCHDSLKMMSVTALSSKPWVVTSHGIAPFWLRKNFIEMTKGVVTNLCYPILYRRASRLVAISPYIQSWLHRYTRRDPVLIANGAEVASDATKRHAPSTPTLLYVGEISRRKGLQDLARAVRLMPSNVTMDIVGVGDVARFFRLDETQSATVNFHGFVSDAELRTLYEGATCVFSASLWEGYGLPVMEGFARGTPALVRRTTNLTNLVIDSDAGKFFETIYEIPSRLDEIIEDWERLSVNAQTFARAHTWENAFAQYRELLLGLI